MAHYWTACHWQHTGDGACPCRAVMVGPAQWRRQSPDHGGS
jgi:hypothetical protein